MRETHARGEANKSLAEHSGQHVNYHARRHRGVIAAQMLGVFERYVDEIDRHIRSEPKSSMTRWYFGKPCSSLILTPSAKSSKGRIARIFP